ncbi:cell division protein FtsX [Sediminitomix flava]|uniref:Cell division protein FtsX n=1 Tax=Sediminitomix flava TaxID=379075 RepID=A0A315Z9Z0_SEDFL|nr:permease-like cell division protein FtsX [Sediminitomix flava]PWJ42351.1 cell division transport system permease protein [Sediminitomix flava]
MSKITKKVGSYPYANVMFSIVSALFMIGLMGLFGLYANKLTTELQDSIEVQVVLQKFLSEEKRNDLQNRISNLEFVNQNIPIRFVSREEAAQNMIQETGEDFIEFLGGNPLHDVFRISIKKDFLEEPRIEELSKDLKKIEGVYDVIYTKSMISQIQSNIQKVTIVLGGLAIMFLLTVVVLIGNAIRLALFSQRFLIRSMQLVGATPFFIKKPFLSRAFLQGVFGGIIASTLLGLSIFLFSEVFSEMKLIFDMRITLSVFISIILLGGIIGFLSAYFSVNHYLKMKLDQLY